MSDISQGLESLGEITGTPRVEQNVAVLRERKVDKLGRAYATGKRKNAIARVWVKPGKGKITINGKESDAYFARPVLRMMINQPFKVLRRWQACRLRICKGFHWARNCAAPPA